MRRFGAGVLGGLTVLGSGYALTVGALLVSGPFFDAWPTGWPSIVMMTVLGTLGVLLAGEVGEQSERRGGARRRLRRRPGS